MNKFETEKQKLLKRREELFKTLNSTQEEVNSINAQIHTITVKERAEALEKMGLKDGSYFVGFAKSSAYHYVMIFGFTVLHISKDNRHIHTISFKYRCDDDDYSLSFINETHTANVLSSDTCDDFNMYAANEEDYMELIRKMSMLSVTRKNFNEIREDFKEKSNTRKTI